jgi:cyanophycinase-like exopeptidase
MNKKKHNRSTPGSIVLFGSGEMSPTGRKIHEAVFKKAGIASPVSIGILETPTGFEVNAINAWPKRMEEFFKKSLQNYSPSVTRIHAWRNEGQYSTNNQELVSPILNQDYLYCGAGSPTYAIRHLKDSLAWEYMQAARQNGTILCLGSATAVAMSRFALPVYEIFKAGEDIHWNLGLDLFAPWISNLVIVPHWNNAEGEDFDTTRCWMGQDRFTSLLGFLPLESRVLGIDEQTACVVNVEEKTLEVLGIGKAYLLQGAKLQTISPGSVLAFSALGLS